MRPFPNFESPSEQRPKKAFGHFSRCTYRYHRFDRTNSSSASASCQNWVPESDHVEGSPKMSFGPWFLFFPPRGYTFWDGEPLVEQFKGKLKGTPTELESP